MTRVEQLDQWAKHLSSLDETTNQSVKKTADQIRSYSEKETPINWSELQSGLGIAEYVLPYCRQHQLLEAAILLPMTSDLTKEALIACITDKTVLELLLIIRKMDIVNATYLKQETTPSNSTQAKLRKMLLALITDIRAVVIKLAEQRYILDRLHKHDQPNGKQLAILARDLYAPLANRLGLYHLKWPIEDLSFRYLEPERYRNIAKGLREKRVEREAFIDYAKHAIEKLLEKELPDTIVTIKGRAKHIYSIHRKSERKGTDPTELFDMTAVRILVDDKDSCYHVLACLHDTWDHIPEEYDDYITQPKGNGYQSIHTVLLINHRLIEIQIRTHAMHQSAELGVAAHWKYKEANDSAKALTPSINWLNELLSWQEDISTDTPNLFQHTFGDRIYVFTPNNQVIDLDVGATPIDFAYAIHTDIGHRCKGAKIGDRMIPLNHPLQTGDVVTILTHKEPRPSRDWLNPERGYVKTRSAINKIRLWFKKLNYDEYLQAGRHIWDRHFKKANIKQSDAQALIKHFNFSSFDNLLIALGNGDISTRTVLRQLRIITGICKKEKTENKTPLQSKEITAKQNKSGIIVDGLGSLMTQLAHCCYPIPGDPIIGYLTASHGITIHHAQCNNWKRDNPKKNERRIDAAWGDTQNHQYSAHIRVICDFDQASTDGLWNTLSQHQIPIIRTHTEKNRKHSRRFHQLVIRVTNHEQLTSTLNALRQSKGILQAERIGITQ